MPTLLCQISGRITDINGSPVQFAIVTWRLDSKSNDPQFLEGNAISTREFPLQTGDDGEFAINLVQGAKMTVKIDAIKLHRQVTIPAQASATLEEVLNADV